jgi:phage-related protein
LHEIHFYTDRNGRQPIVEYITALAKKADKNSRVNFNKMRRYLRVLSDYGTQIGEPYVKHIDGKIWELRPNDERVFFTAWVNGSFLMLHQFTKTSQKTPPEEIKQAKRNLKDYLERNKL